MPTIRTPPYKTSYSAHPLIIEEHIDAAEYLWLQRDAIMDDPSTNLSDLVELDMRLEKHLNGLRSAGDSVGDFVLKHPADCTPGRLFVSTALAFQKADGYLLSSAISASREVDDGFRAVLAAPGWVSDGAFESFSGSLLSAKSVSYRLLGLSGQAMRRVDPGQSLFGALESRHSVVRVRALRAIVELARSDFGPEILTNTPIDCVDERFWASWSLAILGRKEGIDSLRGFVLNPTYARRAANVYFRRSTKTDSVQLLRDMAVNSQLERYAIIGSGVLGDPFFIPGLLTRMSFPHLARAAGEAFSMITGIDLEAHELMSREAPELDPESKFAPAEDLVDFDSDDDLPWPDVDKITQWWQRNSVNFEKGTRYLVGHPITIGNCLSILRFGYQRQRIAAALELAGLAPKNPLFEWRAPGHRQELLIQELQNQYR